MIKNQKFFSFACLAMLSLPYTACIRRSDSVIKAKVFSLSPQNYLEKKVLLFGSVNSLLPAAAGFTLSDDSGKIFVSAENISEKTYCPNGNNILLEGTLRNNAKIQRTYFVMSKLIECSQPNLTESKR